MAVGGLGWSPRTFWRATLAEFFMAVDGRNRVNRAGPVPLTRDEFDELEARYLS